MAIVIHATIETTGGDIEAEINAAARGPKGDTGATGATGAIGAQGDRAGLKYTFDTNTSPGAPSPGHIKFNSATLSAVTRISIRDTDLDGTDTSALLALIDDSTSTVKARVVIRSNSNADTSHFNFLVTSVTDEGNHHHINGTFVSGSAFANNEVVTFDFYATGDKGDIGNTGPAGPSNITTSTATTINGLIKGNGSTVSQAVAGTDYETPAGAATQIATHAAAADAHPVSGVEGLSLIAPNLTDDFTLVMEGDSITQGVTSGGATVGNYLQDRLLLESYFTGRTTIQNVATAGNTIATVLTDYATQVYPHRPSANGGKRAVLLLNIGTNDSTASATQVTNAAAVLAYCATARTDGFEVWLCTLLPRGSTPNHWTYFNNALRKGEDFDKLIDLNGLFIDAAGWTGDNLHPNNLGYRIMSGYINSRALIVEKRDGLSLGSMGKQNSDAVAITGGTFSGSTGTFTGAVTKTSTGASIAEYTSQATGAGGNRLWLFGHNPNAFGNLPANSFSMTFYNGTAFETSLAGFSPNGGIVSNQARLVARTVANLSLLTATIGNKALVNDALSPVISTTVAGSGAKLCEVAYNGSNWIVTSILN